MYAPARKESHVRLKIAPPVVDDRPQPAAKDGGTSSLWAQVYPVVDRIESENHYSLITELLSLSHSIGKLVNQHGKRTIALAAVNQAFSDYSISLQILLVNTRSILLPLCKKAAAYSQPRESTMAGIRPVSEIMQVMNSLISEDYRRFSTLAQQVVLPGSAVRKFESWLYAVNRLHHQTVLRMQSSFFDLRNAMQSVDPSPLSTISHTPTWAMAESFTSDSVNWDELSRKLDEELRKKSTNRSNKVDKRKKLTRLVQESITDAGLAATCLMLAVSWLR